MTITLPPLPYDKAALEPTISARTLTCHYEKHHQGYVDKLNKLIANTPMAQLTLESIIKKTWSVPGERKIFNNAAQVWNHNFFWRSMTPRGGARVMGGLRRSIESAFGSYEKFEQTFVQGAVEQFGSGWTWLVDKGGKLQVITTDDAATPMVLGLHPILVCDVWEHAYYLDYQNDREGFVRGFLSQLANWSFAQDQLTNRPAKPEAVALQRP